MSRIVCIVQARMGSERLPGKVMMDLMGKPMLEHLLDRLKRCRSINEIVIATTDKKNDIPIIDLAKRCEVGYFIGDESDVLGRYWGAAEKYDADIIIRITGDCPLVDPVTLDNLVKEFLNNKGIDYLSNTLVRTFPRGLDVEVFSKHSLAKAYNQAIDKPSREHVTYYMYNHADSFKLKSVEALPPLNWPDLRICVDTKDDFELIEKIYRRLYKPGEIIDILEVLNLISNEPKLLQINAHIEQKKV